MHDQSGSISIHHLAKPSARRSAPAAGRGVIHDDRQFLAQCNLFRVLPADERAKLIARAQIRKYAADATIFLKGSTGDSMMVVLSGHVRISVASPEGKEIIFVVLVAGEVFGEIAMLDGKERPEDARAASECRLAILNRCDVLTVLEQHPNAWPGLVGVLCERLRNADEQMAELALMSIPVRLAKALLRMTAIERQPGNRLSQVPLSQREIGSLIGATRESVNRWLSHWQRMGILQIEENLITVADRQALEELTQHPVRAGERAAPEQHRARCVGLSAGAGRRGDRHRPGGGRDSVAAERHLSVGLDPQWQLLPA
jgi:CRP-like cAMP-binding protein